MFTAAYSEPQDGGSTNWEMTSLTRPPAVEVPAERSATAPSDQNIRILQSPIPSRPIPTHIYTSQPMQMHSEAPHSCLACHTPSHSAPTDSVPTHPMPTRPATSHSPPTHSGSTYPAPIQHAPRSSSLRKHSRSDAISIHFAPPPDPGPTAPTSNPPTQRLSMVTSSTSQSNPRLAAGQYPKGDFRNSSLETQRDLQSAIMVKWLRQMQMEKLWSKAAPGPGEGVVLKKDRGSFVCCPESLKSDSFGFYSQVKDMNVRVCSSFAPLN